jgi:hypothetical protein
MNSKSPSFFVDRQHGSTIVFTMILLLGLLTLTVAGLTAATSGMKVSNNYQTGLQALHAAEAGVGHSQKVINDWGVVRFDNDVVALWDTLFGTPSRQMPGYSSIQYSATATNDPTDASNYMLLTGVGQAPSEAQRTVQVRLRRGDSFSPGAIYLPSDGVTTDFNGTRFLIDGYNTDFGGARTGEGDVPGITTRSEDAVQTVVDSLSNGQETRVIGAGGAPSVQMSGGPTSDRIIDDIVPNVLSQGSNVHTNPPITGNDTFGSVSSPWITHFTGDVTVNGTMNGAGILIIDGSVNITGNLTFTGLILVRGTTDITTVSGNATVLGAIWTTDLRLTVQGSASVTYSSAAMALANQVADYQLPTHVRAIAWNEL